MFKNAYQFGLMSVFYSCGSDPLAIWDLHVQNGHIKRVMDTEINSLVLELIGPNVATTYIACPKASNQVLGIRLPFLVMIVKNLKKYFSFEVSILDDTGMRRRFRISNFQSTTKIKPFCTSMPIGLSGGWNQIQFNLSDFTKRAYSTAYLETQRIQIHANVRLRRIYFADRLYTEEELPQEYKLYLPLESRQKKAEQKKQLVAQKSKEVEGPKPSVEVMVGVEAGAGEAPAAEEVKVIAPEAQKSQEKINATGGEALAEVETPAAVEAPTVNEVPVEEKAPVEIKSEGETLPEEVQNEAADVKVEGEAPGIKEEIPVAEGEIPADEKTQEISEAPTDAEGVAAEAETAAE